MLTVAENLQNTQHVFYVLKVKTFNTNFRIIIVTYVHVCLVVGSSELDMVLEAWFHQC